MNCRAGFYATIINIVAYPSLVGLPGVAGQRARAAQSSRKRVMQISLAFFTSRWYFVYVIRDATRPNAAKLYISLSDIAYSADGFCAASSFIHYRRPQSVNRFKFYRVSGEWNIVELLSFNLILSMFAIFLSDNFLIILFSAIFLLGFKSRFRWTLKTLSETKRKTCLIACYVS